MSHWLNIFPPPTCGAVNVECHQRPNKAANQQFLTPQEDLEEMQKKRDAKEADQQERSRRRVCSVPAAAQHKRGPVEEQEAWMREAEAMGLQNYCSVLQF